jgi:hypothetical protein
MSAVDFNLYPSHQDPRSARRSESSESAGAAAAIPRWVPGVRSAIRVSLPGRLEAAPAACGPGQAGSLRHSPHRRPDSGHFDSEVEQWHGLRIRVPETGLPTVTACIMTRMSLTRMSLSGIQYGHGATLT